MLLEPSSHFGPYEVVGPLGAGGMGEVYRARDPRLGREVALKVLPPNLAALRGGLARFEQEARAASALNHPSIVTVYEFGEAEGLPYIAMELVAGRSLRDVMDEALLPVGRALEIAAKVAFGLARAHEAGILHRDLKPENVMVGRDDTVKLLDFGLAKLADEPGRRTPPEQRLTHAGSVVGTPAYMSPEQARGAPLDHRSDQFSLGLVLYEALAGTPAFGAESAAQTMSAIIEQEAPPLQRVAPRVPSPVRWVVERCLSKDPDGRYAATSDLARELASLPARLGESQATAAVPAVRPRRRLSAAAAGLLGLLLGAGAALVALHRRPEPVPSLVPLTHSGSDSAPACSPDGRLVAFTSTRDGTPRIWLKDLTGGAEAPLTAGPDDFARFSPDGTRLLFVRDQRTGHALFGVPALGGEARRLMDDAESADWSPDGRSVAFVRVDRSGAARESRLGIADADGGNPRIVARLPGRSALHPRWSPDGGRIAFLSSALDEASGSLSVFDLATLSVSSLVAPTAGAHLSSVAWTGSGDAVVYARSESRTPFVLNTNGAARVLLQPANGGTPRTLLFAPWWGATLDVAGPSRLVLESRVTRGALSEHALSESDASLLRWLTRGTSSDRQPVYAPSGDRILFSSNRTGDWDVWSLEPRTGALRNVTDHRSDDWDPAFLGSGERVLWSSNRGGHFEVWTANADGSQPRKVSEDGVDAENPTATPDGSLVVYSSANPAKAGLWKVRADGTGAARIVVGRAFLPEVSPDGVHVLYVTNTGAQLAPIRVARVADGAAVAFVIGPGGAPGPHPTGRARWLPDGRGIAFVGVDGHGRSALLAQDFRPAGGTESTRRTLHASETGTEIETFGISPDGGRIAVGTRERLTDLTLAEGLAGVTPPRRARR